MTTEQEWRKTPEDQEYKLVVTIDAPQPPHEDYWFWMVEDERRWWGYGVAKSRSRAVRQARRCIARNARKRFEVVEIVKNPRTQGMSMHYDCSHCGMKDLVVSYHHYCPAQSEANQ